MARPKVFVSSTYYDLKHIRASVEIFVENLGFEAILSEGGSIAYDPSQPLDESCYREAQSSDIFVLIVGGRYGSEASKPASEVRARADEFESITRREFSRAHDADIPVYVLIESGVYSEYQTYLRNKSNKDINYAHVDSVRVFEFIEFIHGQQRNNPIQAFEKGADIEGWLRDQWAGLFQELLRRRQDSSQFATLASQIRELEAVNSTLKSYLESVLDSVSPENSKSIIEQQNESLSRSRMLEKAKRNDWFEYVLDGTDLSTDQCLDLHISIGSVNDIIPKYEEVIGANKKSAHLLATLYSSDAARRDFLDLRKTLNLSEVRFTDKSLNSLKKFHPDPDSIFNQKLDG